MPSVLKKLFLISFFGFAIGGLGILFWQAVNRNPASTLPTTHQRPKPWADSLSGKMNQAMTVVITPIGGIPDHDEQDLLLKAEVTLNQNIDGEVTFQWTLPPEASVVSGELQDAWANLKPGQTATAEITINHVSREGLSKTIFFHAMGKTSGIKIGGVGAFATNETAFDHSVPGPTETKTSSEEKLEISNETILKKERLAEKLNRTHQ